MSPFAQYLHELRIRHNMRQAELAKALGYEQSYISALEVSIKGPPTEEFVERLVEVLSLPHPEQKRLRMMIDASQRKLVIAADAAPEVYWLLKDLRDELNGLCPAQIRLMRDILKLRNVLLEEKFESMRGIAHIQSDPYRANEMT